MDRMSLDDYAAHREGLKARVLARCAAGETLTAIGRDPQMPTVPCVWNWARADLRFWTALAEALAEGKAARETASGTHPRWRFDDARAAQLIARVAAGERLYRVLADPQMPSQKVFLYWRRTQPEFAAELSRVMRARAAGNIARWRPKLRVFDRAIADKIVARVAAGTPLKAVLAADKDLPQKRVVARWRVEQPDFDRALRIAGRVAARVQRGPGHLCTPALRAEIVARVCEGESLAQIGEDPRMPHRVTLYRWVRGDADFEAEIAWACEVRADELEGEILGAIRAAPRTATASAMKARLRPIRARLGRLRQVPGARRRRRAAGT